VPNFNLHEVRQFGAQFDESFPFLPAETSPARLYLDRPHRLTGAERKADEIKRSFRLPRFENQVSLFAKEARTPILVLMPFVKLRETP
jgi:hypothetical protein